MSDTEFSSSKINLIRDLRKFLSDKELPNGLKECVDFITLILDKNQNEITNKVLDLTTLLNTQSKRNVIEFLERQEGK